MLIHFYNFFHIDDAESRLYEMMLKRHMQPQIKKGDSRNKGRVGLQKKKENPKDKRKESVDRLKQ